jgi:hypothetical protein
MTKRPTSKPPTQDQWWDIYKIKSTPAAFVGTVKAPTSTAAIKVAIQEFVIIGEARKRLIAQRR